MELNFRNIFKKRKRLKIGDYYLDLDFSNPHEKKYFESIENDDYHISKNLIQKGDRVLDLGANIGFTALLYLSFGASEVYAFEPVANLVKRLRAIKSGKIKVFDCALSDYNGTSEIYLSTTHNQGHSLNDSWPERFSNVFKQIKKEKVKVATLDTLLVNEVFDFIKIDVEGMEEKAIIGGEMFFQRNKNSIVQIEIYEWQFENTHKILSRFYSHAFVPIIEKNQVIKFERIYSLEDSNKLGFKGAPNYIYSNKSL